MPTIRSILSYSIYSMHARCSFWPSIVSCLIGPSQVSVKEHKWSCQPPTLCLVPLSPPVKCQCHRALELLCMEDSVKNVYGIDFQLSPALLALLRCQLRKTLVLPASNLVSGAPVNVIGHRPVGESVSFMPLQSIVRSSFYLCWIQVVFFSGEG